jgi:hypothetical protein
MNLPTEETKIVFRDADPAAADTWTNITSTNFLDMSGYHRLMVVAFRTVGLANAGLRIRASAAAAGSSAVTVGTTIGTTSNTGLLNGASNGSIGNPGCGLLVAECTYDDVVTALEGGRYVSAQILAANATDEWGVAFIFSSPRYATSGLTVTGNSL